MARLIYSAIMSLDGYIAGADPDASNGRRRARRCTRSSTNSSGRSALISSAGGCTRRCAPGKRAHTVAGQPPVALDFARIWQAADKIVYSTTLQTPDTARTRLERDFDPVQVRKLKEAADRDLTVGGARLAAQAIAAGLVDEYQLFVVPAVAGGGTRALLDQVRLNLALAEEHRFGSGTVYLCYRPA